MAVAKNDPFLLLNSDFALQHAGYEEEKGEREGAGLTAGGSTPTQGTE